MIQPFVLMYVYFDRNGDIKAITPTASEVFSKDYEHMMVPLTEVEPFIMGTKNTFDYTVKRIKKVTGESFKLIRKVASVNITRSLDNYLTKISPYHLDSDPVLRVIYKARYNVISLFLNETYKQLYNDGLEEEIEQIEAFLNSGRSIIYITEKNNPYSLLFSFEFLPKDLFENLTLDFPVGEEVDLRNSSAYTKRLVDSYQYVIKE